MSYKQIIEGDLSSPGQWRGAKRDDGDGRGFVRTANVSCPGCGRGASLSQHRIRDDGAVAPSLVCPYDDCEFHEFVILAGWEPEVKE